MTAMADWNSFAAEVAELKTNFATAEQALSRITGDFELLNDAVTGTLDQIQNEKERGAGRIETFFATVEADVEEMIVRIDETVESVAELFDSEMERLREVGDEFRDFLVEQTEEAWRVPVAEAAEAWREELEETFEQQVQRFTEAENAVREAITEALESLEQFAKEDLADMVEEEARETLDAALARLRDEVMDGITTSNLQVTLTSTMAPILPQLMVVRTVASVIKNLLDVMRMGL